MPGYNHYPWCPCGWCYKHGWNFYSPRTTMEDFDRSFAERRLKETGAIRSWTACFVNPNAWCPECGAKVFFYQNQYGSRVYFDELGWPWPRHPCTDSSTRTNSTRENAPQPISQRARGAIIEILEAASVTGFDPNAEFRSKFGRPPWDLMIVDKVVRLGFENVMRVKSLSPSVDKPLFVSFTSAKTIPCAGDYISLDDDTIAILDKDSFELKKYQARTVSKAEFDSSESQGRA
jgi:hypothetical protein